MLGLLTKRCYTCKCKGPVELLAVRAEQFDDEFDATAVLHTFEQQAGATLQMLTERFDFSTPWQGDEPFFQQLVAEREGRAHALFANAMDIGQKRGARRSPSPTSTAIAKFDLNGDGKISYGRWKKPAGKATPPSKAFGCK